MVNCNPETVSTDYDTSDRLYFEPLRAEEVLEICDRERPEGVVIQFGGQTPLRLARALEDAGHRILGTPYDAVDLAEDRERFAALCERLGVAVPPWGVATTRASAVGVAEEIGYPVLVRPSYVLGGRSMRVCYEPEDVRARGRGLRARARRPLPRGRRRDRRRRALRRRGHLGRCADGARRGGRRPLGRLLVRAPAGRAPGGRPRRVHRRRPRSRARPRRRRADQRPARAPRGPASSSSRPTRAPRARSRSRRKALGVNLVEAACKLVAGAPLSVLDASRGQTARPCLREGVRLPLRPLPGRGRGARAGDALDGGGHGHRGRLPDRVRQGRARRREAAPDRGHGVPLRPRRGQARRRRAGAGPGRARLRALRDRRDRVGARGRRAEGGRHPQGHRAGRRPHGGRPDPPPARRARGQHARRARCPLRRLPHPRGRARSPACPA